MSCEECARQHGPWHQGPCDHGIASNEKATARLRQLKFSKRTLRHEFGPPHWQFPPLPTVRRAWEDNSWHNDVCPSFDLMISQDEHGMGPTLRLWIDEARPDQREIGGKTYILAWFPKGVGEGDCDVLIETDDLERLNALLAALEL